MVTSVLDFIHDWNGWEKHRCVNMCPWQKKQGEILVGICQDECVNCKLRVMSTNFFDISGFGLNMPKKCYIWV
jgi:hypothetical protein